MGIVAFESEGRIGQRIAELHRQTLPWEEKYGCTYEVFYARVTGDEEYVANLRQCHPTWERAFQQWEFYVEEMHEWIEVENNDVSHQKGGSPRGDAGAAQR